MCEVLSNWISAEKWQDRLCVGPTGTGKNLTIGDKSTRSMSKEFSPEFIAFSAKTSANQTQDLIDSKLDKRYKVNKN